MNESNNPIEVKPMESKSAEVNTVDTVRPKSNCNKCNGTGRLGYINGDLNNPLICQCVVKKFQQLKEQAKVKSCEQKSN